MADNKALIAREGGCRGHVGLINGPNSTLEYLEQNKLHISYLSNLDTVFIIAPATPGLLI